ncbi:hypothetical protein NMY22_g1725 [Coprinellus aureogranulatus]|nr:hypothetical protein NMY22_g1725 [Coprinellus aureogranulatus]
MCKVVPISLLPQPFPPMGRRAKYLTLEDKRRGERERRALRSSAPGSQLDKRRAESRRSYHKKRALQLHQDHARLESMKSLADAKMSKPDYHWLFRQFFEGRTTWEFGAIEMEEKDFESLTRLPPYPTSITMADGFLEDWESIEAAIHGFLHRTHASQCEELIKSARQHRRIETMDALLKRNRELTFELEQLSRHHEIYDRTGQWAESDVAFQNKKWRAQLMIYNVQEIEALEKGVDILVHTLSERLWSLGRPY